MKGARNLLAGIGLLIGLTHGAHAAGMPEDGLAAEMAGRWDEALSVYERALEADPGRADLWRRVADIQSRLGHLPEAAEALERVVALRPDGAGDWFELSRARAQLDQPQQALAACRQALRLRPDELDYLRTCAAQASWAGELELARELYGLWLARQPAAADAQWGLARVDGWAGYLDASARGYRRYLAAHDDNAEAWLEYVQVEIWRGDYAAADRALQDYRARFGDDARARRLNARLLARAELPDAAMAANAPLLAAAPRDYELNYTRTLALRAGRRPAEAEQSLDILRELRPDSPDTRDVMRFVRTPNRDHLRGSFDYYDDSDAVTIRRLALDGRHVSADKATAWLAGIGHERLKAPLGSGLETADGHAAIDVQTLWLGVEHRFDPRLAGGVRAGVARVQRGAQLGTYQLHLDWDPADALHLRAERRRALYDLSPRAVSLQVMENRNLIGLNWRPDLSWFVDAQAGWSDFSDGNDKWQLVVAPRRAVVRRAHFNLDLGVSGEWFGFDRDLNNGYYDPEWYRRYALTAFGYWKIDDDNGISAALSLGWHRDHSMSSYEFGEDVVVEGFFGIYRDWYLRVRSGYAERYQAAGSYDGLSLSASLMRRF